MEFAHSLNYPHYELMLDDLTQRQCIELLIFFSMKQRKEENDEDAKRAANIKQRFMIAEAYWKKEQNAT